MYGNDPPESTSLIRKRSAPALILSSIEGCRHASRVHGVRCRAPQHSVTCTCTRLVWARCDGCGLAVFGVVEAGVLLCEHARLLLEQHVPVHAGVLS